jgi:nitrogen fixation protein FixH
MTEFYEAVEQQREILELEKQAKQIVAIDTRYKDGLWYKQTVDYADGRRVTEYRDKRRATIEENRYGEDMD